MLLIRTAFLLFFLFSSHLLSSLERLRLPMPYHWEVGKTSRKEVMSYALRGSKILKGAYKDSVICVFPQSSFKQYGQAVFNEEGFLEELVFFEIPKSWLEAIFKFTLEKGLLKMQYNYRFFLKILRKCGFVADVQNKYYPKGVIEKSYLWTADYLKKGLIREVAFYGEPFFIATYLMQGDRLSLVNLRMRSRWR